MLRKRRLSQVIDSLETSTHSSSPDSDGNITKFID